MGLLGKHHIVTPTKGNERTSRVMAIINGLNVSSWDIDDALDERAAEISLAREMLDYQQPENTFLVFDCLEVLKWSKRNKSTDDKELPDMTIYPFTENDDCMYPLLRCALDDENIPDEVLAKIVATYDDTVKTAMSISKKIKTGDHINEMIVATFHENSRKILDKYYSKVGFGEEIETIGAVAFLPDVPNVRQAALFVRSTMMDVRYIFIKARYKGMYVLVSMNDTIDEEDERNYIFLEDGYDDHELFAPIVAATGIQTVDPTVYGDCVSYAVSSIEDARVLAHAIDDYIFTGKKTITVDVVYDKLSNGFITKDKNFDVYFHTNFNK